MDGRPLQAGRSETREWDMIMAKTDQKVLVVDDDPTMVHLLKTGLAADQDLYEVITAGGAEEAMEILRRIHVSLVVSDVRMPGMSGLDLLARIREMSPATRVVLMTAAPASAIADEARHGGCLHLFQKPIDIGNLRELIERELTRKQGDGFAGTLNNIQLTDLIQMCCFSGISTAIKVHMEGQTGFIYIEKGEIIHARDDQQDGVDAFFRIFFWRSGRFETLGDIPVPARSIDKNWQYLLMEGHRLMDEANAAAEPSGSPPPSSKPSGSGTSDSPGTQDSLLDSEDLFRLDIDDDAGMDTCIGELEDAISIMLDPEEPELQPAPAGRSEPARSDGGIIKVLIVDDSPIMCKVLTGILTADPGITVVATALNGEQALERIRDFGPNLITLDVNMPVMSGSTAIKHIMIEHPCPVVIVSALHDNSQSNILQFLLLGAIDFLPKPTRVADPKAQERLFVQRIKMAAAAHPARFKRPRLPRANPRPDTHGGTLILSESLAVILSGAGGYTEVIKLLAALPPDLSTCILAVQVMAPSFVNPFVNFLGCNSAVHIQPLAKAVPACRGRCFVTAGDHPVSIRAMDGVVRIFPGLQASRPKSDGLDPDDLLTGAVEALGDRVSVILLSGAASGTRDGIRAVRGAGGPVIIQRPETCLAPDPLSDLRETGLISDIMDVPDIARWLVRSSGGR